MKSKRKYLVIWCACVVLVISVYLRQGLVAAEAVEGTNNTTFGLTYADGDNSSETEYHARVEDGASDNGFTITVSATNASDSCETVNGMTIVTIRNNGTLRIESMKITLSPSNQFTNTACTDGATYNSSTGVVAMPVGSSVSFKFTATDSITAGTITASDILREETKVQLTVNPANDSQGSIAYQGSSVTSTVANEISVNETVSFSATAKAGYAFLCWQDGTGRTLSTNAEYTDKFSTNTSVTPVFCANTNAAYSTSGYHYLCLDEAVAKAQNGDKSVVVVRGGNLTVSEVATSYTIPSGVTVRVPYSASDEIWSASDNKKATSSADVLIGTAYCTWTIPVNFTLKVEGCLLVNAVQGRMKTPYMGSVSGNYGLLKLAAGTSKVEVLSGGVLHARGLIQGTGEVIARSGATVYQFLEIVDFRGGTYTSSIYKTTFPVNQMYVQNIQTKTRYYAGSALKGNTYFYASSTAFPSEVNLIAAAGEKALFTFDANNDESAYILFEYSVSRAQSVVSIYADVTAGVIQISIGAYSVNTSSYCAPLSGAFSVHICSGYSLSIPNKYQLLPDCTIAIDEGGTLDIKNGGAIYLYDSAGTHYPYPTDASYGYRKWPSTAGSDKQQKTITTLQGARLIVLGKLNVESGGALYTSSDSSYSIATHPSIVGGETGCISFLAAVARNTTVSMPLNTKYSEKGTGYFTSAVSDFAGYATAQKISSGEYYWSNGYWYQRPISAAFVACKGDVTYDGLLTVVGGANGYISNGGSFTLTLPDGYALSAVVAPEGHTIEQTTQNGNVYTYSISGVTSSEALKAQTIVITVYMHQVVIDAAKSPTCTETGLTEGKHCAVCSEVLLAQNEISSLGHTETAIPGKAATCTEPGLTEGSRCSVCNTVLVAQEEVPATGHSYTSVVTAPTCTEQGYTTHTCHCGDSYKDTYVSATGHSIGWTNSGKVYTLTCVHGDMEEGFAVNVAYRLDNYIWLNATVTDTLGVDYSLEGAQCLGAYIIRQISAAEIPNALTLEVVYGTVEYSLDIGLAKYKEMITDLEDIALIDAMLLYGEAVEDRFGNGEDEVGNDNGVTVNGTDKKDPQLAQPTDLPGATTMDKPYGDNVTVTRVGMTIGFGNCIQFVYGFNLNGVDLSRVKEIGLLYSPYDADLDKQDELVAKESSYAYVLYQKAALSEDSGNLPNVGTPNPKPTNSVLTSLDDLADMLNENGCYLITYDMKYADYSKTYNYRPYVLYEDGTVVYGEQFAYSLATYIGNRLPQATEDTTEKHLLWATWNFKKAAEAWKP